MASLAHLETDPRRKADSTKKAGVSPFSGLNAIRPEFHKDPVLTIHQTKQAVINAARAILLSKAMPAPLSPVIIPPHSSDREWPALFGTYVTKRLDHPGTDLRLNPATEEFARKHQLLPPVAVAYQIVTRIYTDRADVMVMLERDYEDAEYATISFRIRASGLSLDELSVQDEKLHDELWASLPPKALELLSFHYDFN